MKQKAKEARKHFDKTKSEPACSCTRCGMTQQEHTDHGKGKLQIHHIQAIRDLGLEANTEENYHTLCYFCHREWHCFWEAARRPYKDFFAARSFFLDLINTAS